MAKVAKKKKKKLGGLRGSGAGGGAQDSGLRPKLVEATPPCMDTCPNSNAIREMLMTISQAEDLEKTQEQAFEEAFYIFMETTPFPAVCGRVCPHPCEVECNRGKLDDPIAINNIKRYIADTVMKDGLPDYLKKQCLPEKLPITKRQKVAIVGSGPAGLTAAYFLIKKGYAVTVFEAAAAAGGMMAFGVPEHRLPRKVVEWEINSLMTSDRQMYSFIS